MTETSVRITPNNTKTRCIILIKNSDAKVGILFEERQSPIGYIKSESFQIFVKIFEAVFINGAVVNQRALQPYKDLVCVSPGNTPTLFPFRAGAVWSLKCSRQEWLTLKECRLQLFHAALRSCAGGQAAAGMCCSLLAKREARKDGRPADAGCVISAEGFFEWLSWKRPCVGPLLHSYVQWC